MMDTPISRVGIARSPTKASRCRVLDGSSVIRHRRDPGLQTAIISNTKAMASTRIQLMTNGTRTLARASVTGTIAPRSS